MSRKREGVKAKADRLMTEAAAMEARNTSIMHDLINEGLSIKALATKYGLSTTTIRDVIGRSREAWRDYRVDDYELLLTVELHKIAMIEAEAWEAYERSKKPLVTQTRRTDGTRNERGDLNVLFEEVKTQSRHPDPRYLATVQWCTEQRLKIMGGYAPEKHAATTPDGKQYAPFSVVEVILPSKPIEEPIYIEAEVAATDHA